MSTTIILGRRQILEAGAAGLALLVGCRVEPTQRIAAPHPAPTGTTPPAPAPAAAPFVPNAWVRVGGDGTVTVLIDKAEMGQGIETGLAMLVAEELECDWTKVRTEFAPVDAVYKNPIFGMQATGGSTSIRGSFDPLRKAGATARVMLIGAAADQWGVDPSTCHAENGEVVHPPSGKRAPFGTLVEAASKKTPPSDVPLKPRSAWKLLGTRVTRIDAADKARGAAGYGLDVNVPGMHVAVVVRPPVFGATATRFDPAKAQGVPGVKKVVQIESGVAVVADTYWTARKASKLLDVTWSANDGPSNESIMAEAARMAKSQGAVAEKAGDPEAALAKARKKIDAVYLMPYQAHATMEPMNATADVKPSSCEVWAPTQFPEGVAMVAAKITGLGPSAIKVHSTFLGGGFGRRFERDFSAEAIALSKEMQAPVKVVWSREDDLQHDFYRPASYNALRGAIGDDGMPVAWTHRAVSESIMTRAFPGMPLKNGVDESAVEGGIELPYAIPNFQVDWHKHDTGVPVGFWRSVGNSLNAFVSECFLDELAALAGKDPFEYRKALMTDPKHARLRAVLELAAEKAGWGKPLGPGRGRGIAAKKSFDSYVAEVAEVTVDAKGNVKVDRVVCACDCGAVVNLDQVEAQMEGGIVYGLTAALKGEITMEKGGAKESNFDRFPLLRMDEMPQVEVYVVPSDEKPTGAGEPGTPPIAPAIANAIFAATGKRLRRLPIRPEDIAPPKP